MSELLTFTRGVPADESFAVDELIACAEKALRDHWATILQYHPPRGFLPLWEAIAEREGVPVERVILGNGSIHLLDSLIRTATVPGDAVLVERPTYDRTINALRRAGLDVHGIPMYDDGPDLDALTEAVERFSPRLFYTIPRLPESDRRDDERRQARGDRRARRSSRHADRRRSSVPATPVLGERTEADPRVPWCSDRSDVVVLEADQPRDAGRMDDRAPGGARSDGRAGRCGLHLSEHGASGRGVRVHPTRTVRADDRTAQGAVRTAIACIDALDRHLPEADYVRLEGGFFLGLTLPQGCIASGVRERAGPRREAR